MSSAARRRVYQGQFRRRLQGTVFYRNIADREAVSRVRREYFGSTRPASTAVEVSRLVKDDLLVEIEVIAVRPRAG